MPDLCPICGKSTDNTLYVDKKGDHLCATKYLVWIPYFGELTAAHGKTIFAYSDANNVAADRMEFLDEADLDIAEGKEVVVVHVVDFSESPEGVLHRYKGSGELLPTYYVDAIDDKGQIVI
jgi:hypothetical protein